MVFPLVASVGTAVAGAFSGIAGTFFKFLPSTYAANLNAQVQTHLQGRREEMEMRRMKVEYLRHQENQVFQSEMAALGHERQKELAKFHSEVEMKLQDRNFDFQRWSMEQQKNLQMELQTRRENVEAERMKLDYLKHRENQKFQSGMAALSHERQKELAEFRANVDRMLQDRNLDFQRWSLEQQKNLQMELQTRRENVEAERMKLDYLKHRENQKFQSGMAALGHERQKELAEFRANVDRMLQDRNFDFQRWSMEQQKGLQMELQRLNAELMREMRAYDRETQLNLIKERKKSDNSPIWLVVDQIVNMETGGGIVPLRIFFAPPSLPNDSRGGGSPEGFPQMTEFLAHSLRSFLGRYSAEGRPTDFVYGAWTSKFFHGEAAAISLYDAMKSEPVLILESGVEGDRFSLNFGTWNMLTGRRYESPVSGLKWPEILNEFAKNSTAAWLDKKEEWIKSGETEQEFYELHGENAVKCFLNNLKIAEREQKAVKAGIDPGQIERKYLWHKENYEQLKSFVAACHCFTAGLLADEYFLLYVPHNARSAPLLPAILPDLLKDLPASEIPSIISRAVSFYRNLYQHIAQNELLWLSELLLDLCQSLMNLPDRKWAREQVLDSVREWLKLRGMADTGSLPDALDAMETGLTISDADYAERLNRCLKDVGEDRAVSVKDSCFRRGLRRYGAGEFQAAIADFHQAIELDGQQAAFFYNRGLAFSALEQWEDAAADYSASLNLNPEQAEAFNNRGNAFYKLGQHEKAIADYEQALKIHPGYEKALRNRDIVQGVRDEIQRKFKEEAERKRKEEEERKLKEEAERKRKAEEERKLKEEAERKRKAEEERKRKEEAERKRKEEEARRLREEAERKRKDEENRKINGPYGKKISGPLPAMEFVWIPAGSFMMGSPEDEPGRSDDEKQHRVTLTKGFYMQTTPVTQAQWKAVTGDNPSGFEGDSRPVENVSWNDVQEFIKKLNRRESTDEYCLPTEAQWEYACRAGTTTALNSGERLTSTDGECQNLNRLGWYGKNSGSETHPVGKKAPNAWGLFDMHGNVWEWCQDWYGNYPEGHVTDPAGASSGAHRVLRGGCWCYGARYCRSADRIGNSPDSRYGNFGFRLVRFPA